MNTQVSKPALYVLVGLPGSGKSTWTKSFIGTKLLHSQGRQIVVISTDDILERIAEEKGITYGQAHFAHAGEADKQMKAMAKAAFACKVDIIWDQTNLGEKKRKKILNQTPKEYEKVAVVFEVNEQELTNRLNRRAAETGKHIPSKVVEDMRKMYVKPTKAEGFDDIFEVKETIKEG
jgi:predicted kinase